MTATPPDDDTGHGPDPRKGPDPRGGGSTGYGRDPYWRPGYGEQSGQGPTYQGAPSGPGGWGPPLPPLRPEDQRLWATLVHVGGIFFSIIVPLVGYFVLRDRGPFVREHTRVSLNFHLTMLIAYVVGGITSWLGIGLLVIFAVGIVSIVFSVIAAVRASAGEFYRYPLSIDFVKH